MLNLILWVHKLLWRLTWISRMDFGPRELAITLKLIILWYVHILHLLQKQALWGLNLE